MPAVTFPQDTNNVTRLEPRCIRYSIENGIQARVKDPLFFLGRQFQLSEFRQFTNGGHPVRTQIQYGDRELDRIKLSGSRQRDAAFQPYDPNKPLEYAVESEITPSTGAIDAKAWNDRRLEYQYSIGAEDMDIELLAEENFGFSDWFSFDLKTLEDPMLWNTTVSMQPDPISFNGMPVPRWWTFEDRNNDLSNLRRPDMNFLSMILIEFSLLFESYDSYILPMTHKVGTLRKIASIQVVDSFGFISEALPAVDKTPAKQGWELFTLQSLTGDRMSDGRLFYLPNTLADSHSSPDQESVSFFRDETNRVVWAVEEYYIKNGKPFNRNDNDERTTVTSAPAPYFYWDVESKSLVSAEEKQNEKTPGSRYFGPLALYQPMKELELNWIPYVPSDFPDRNEFILRRSRTQRDTSAGPQYKGQILSESMYINEEEVPKIGISVKRQYQLARDNNGEMCLWLGRKKVIDDKKRLVDVLFDTLVEK